MFTGYPKGARHSSRCKIQSAVGLPWGTEMVDSLLHSVMEFYQVCARERQRAEHSVSDGRPRTGREVDRGQSGGKAQKNWKYI